MALEGRSGMSLGEFVNRLTRVNVTCTVVGLWAGLLHEAPDLTLEDVKGFLTEFCDSKGGDLSEVTNTLDTAIAQSTPLRNVKSGNAKPKAKKTN